MKRNNDIIEKKQRHYLKKKMVLFKKKNSIGLRKNQSMSKKRMASFKKKNGIGLRKNLHVLVARAVLAAPLKWQRFKRGAPPPGFPLVSPAIAGQQQEFEKVVLLLEGGLRPPAPPRKGWLRIPP